MGIIRRGILGGFSGKVANIVGSSWKGIAVMKSLPLSVANPRTTAQTEQRTKFSNTVAFAKAILTTVIKPLWDRFAQQQSGFNAFISRNIELFENEIPTPANELVISQGKMEETIIDDVTATDGSRDITVDWTDDPTGLQNSSDIPYIVLWINEEEKAYGFDLTGTATRASETATVTIDQEMTTGDNGLAWLAFKREDGTVVSNTSSRPFSTP
ncbi:MAG: DUF6266 family protein [Bacteroidota bacterium]